MEHTKRGILEMARYSPQRYTHRIQEGPLKGIAVLTAMSRLSNAEQEDRNCEAFGDLLEETTEKLAYFEDLVDAKKNFVTI